MNDIQYLIDRQLGNYCQFNYDNVLKRLVVEPTDSYYGLQNNGVAVAYDQDPPIFACRFSEAPGCKHILALANEDGKVAIQNTYKRNSVLECFQCHNNAVFDLAWMPGHMNFVTVSGDHTVCLWDVSEGSPRKLQAFTSHMRSVKTAVFPPREPHIFATGARDGHIFVWDTRSGSRPDNRLAHCHRVPAEHPNRLRLDAMRPISVTGLAFQDDVTLLSAGECDGNIKVWDLRRNYSVFKREPLPKCSIPYSGGSTKNGYTNLVVDDARMRLYASCMDNVIYCFNISTYNAMPEQRYVGHENATFYIKASLSPDCRYLASGSGDSNAYVWNVKHPQPILRLVGHHAEVTCATWCADADAKLVTCGDDARHMVWRVGAELERADTPADEPRRARAELVPRADGADVPQRLGLHHTPDSLKRRSTATPSSRSAKRHKMDARDVRKPKRCLLDLMTKAPGEPAIKRTRFDGSPLCDSEDLELLPTGIKRHLQITEETTPIKKRFPPDPSDTGKCSLRPGPSHASPSKDYEKRTCQKLPSRKRKLISPDSPTKDTSLSTSPTKVSPTKGSPVKVSPTKMRILSFIENLPDFVSTGEAPHLALMSPVKKKLLKTDWLTLMIKAKKTKTETNKFFDTPLEKRTPKSNVKIRSLLTYFKSNNC